MVPTDDSPDTNDSMILQEETDQQLSDIEKEKIIEAIENEMQKESNNGLKMDIHANTEQINAPLKKDSTDDDIRSDAFIKLYEISKQNQQNNNIQPISGNNRQSINESFKKDLINDEIWREALKKLSARSKQYNHNNVARTGNNRQQINVLQRDLIQRDKELWERIRLRIAELQKEEQQDPLRKQIKDLNQKEQQSIN